MKIGITNLKGGVGKTTLSINLAVSFATMGYNVAVIDTDTNQNSLGWRKFREEGLPNVSVWGHTIADTLLSQVKELYNHNDIVIMDGTPNLGLMSRKIMLASDLLLIPIRPGAHDYRSMNEFYEILKETRGDVANYILLNEYDERITMHRMVVSNLKANFDIPHLSTVIKSRTAYGESALAGTGVLEGNDPKAKAEIAGLTKEILEKAQQHNLIKENA